MKKLILVLHKKANVILLTFYILYIALVIFGVYHHEPWRDEAHAWVQARELSLVQLLAEVKHEGTPMLWYIVLAPFAKLGFPYETMQVIHACIAVFSVGLILFYTKIPLSLKIFFIFSYYMAYEYAVIARNYVLTILLLLLIALNYSKRFEKSLTFAFLIALLFQTNSYSLGPAVILMLTFCAELLYRRKLFIKNLSAISIMVGGGIFSLFMLLPDRSIPYYTAPPPNSVTETFSYLRSSIVPSFPQITDGLFFSQEFNTIILLLTPVLFLSFFTTIVRRLSLLLLTIGMFGWQWYVNAVVHGGTLRHHGLTLIFLMFLYIISLHERNRLFIIERVGTAVFHISLSCLLILSLPFTLYIYREEFLFSFSGAKDMAYYIKSHGLEKMEIVAYDGGSTEAVVSYLAGKKFWYPQFDGAGHFNVAGEEYLGTQMNLSLYDAITKMKKHLSTNPSAIILFSAPIPYEEIVNFTYLHESGAKYFWSNETENFWLYRNKSTPRI